ncbi:hypothetical protein VKT23_006604 [Stygiomarasmius scandens]|uniref:Uncharacterized protein n=1 Tax=Marasmiellus scandens TaxID=2682957 RepID=A0ABR1JN99_9AGAR
MGLKNVSFDDRDRAHLKYSNNWFFTGSWNASDAPGDPTGTQTSSDGLDANVTFTFPQPANAFYYYAFKRSGGGLYAICIDCDPNNPNFEKIDALGPDDGKEAPVLLFSKTFGDFGVHEIILTNQNDTRRNPAGTSQITVDRFEIQVQGDSSDPSSFLSSTPSSSSPTTSPTTSSITSHSRSVGPVAGGITGGLVALLGLCALMLFCIRRKRKLDSDSHPSLFPNTRSFLLAPYGPIRSEKLPNQSNPAPVVTPPSRAFSMREGDFPRSQPYPSTSQNSPEEFAQVGLRGAGLSDVSVDKPLGQPMHSQSLIPAPNGQLSSDQRQRAVDGGPITMTELEHGSMLPPDYQQVFGNV